MLRACLIALVDVCRRKCENFSFGTNFGDGSAYTKALARLCFACTTQSRDAQAGFCP